MKHIKLLKSFDACLEAVEWVKTQPDLETAWNNCQRCDWMIWLAEKMSLFSEKDLRLMACQFLRCTPKGKGTVWDALGDVHKNCVIVAERYANGDATKEELTSARDSVSHIWPQDIGGYFHPDAAWATPQALAWASAESSAWASAQASAQASVRASAWGSARASAPLSARASARAFQSDIIREFGNPFNGNEIKGV